MTKKITMSTKPKKEAQELTPDVWVSQGATGAALATNGSQTEKETTARFTIDIPVSLHARIKSQCALKRVKMRDEVLAILEKHFPLN
jgi:hypothetical protein